MAKLLLWAPWLSLLLTCVPAPLVFFVLFLMSSATDSAALYLALSVATLGLGLVLGLLLVALVLLYRRSWLKRFRDELAADGVTAEEVVWFMRELTSAERKTLNDIRAHNPLLADAYCETLASRLTATRVISRVRSEQLKVERRINQARNIKGADTTELLQELESDHHRLTKIRREADLRLSESKARLQTIEASASRELNQAETDMMLRRLSSAQEHLPLAIEMAKLEQEALREVDREAGIGEVRSDD